MPYFSPVFLHTPHGIIPAWYPTVALATDVREWDAIVGSATPPAPPLPNPIVNNRLQVSLYRILLEAGLAFTSGVGLRMPSASSLAPLYRYIDLFTGTAPRLRLIAGLQPVDARFKQLIAEEVALGVAWYVLKHHLNAVWIADVGPLFTATPQRPQHVDFVAGSQSEEPPDYFCLDPQNEAFFMESKGAVGPRSLMSSPAGRLSHGKAQVQNVMSTIYQLRNDWGRIVIGTNLRLDAPLIRSDTATHVYDPVGSRGGREGNQDDFPFRVAYAKVLKYAGQLVAAELLLAYQEWELPAEITTLLWHGLQLVPLGNAPIGGLVTMDLRVFRVLRNNQEGNLFARLSPTVDALTQLSNEFVGNGGSVVQRDGTVVLIDEEEVETMAVETQHFHPIRR